jgi:hypothetical protein
MNRETMKRKRLTTRVSVPLVLCPRVARTQPTSRADLVNGTNTTLALNFTKAYFKQWAVALLLMASEDGYKRQYRVALCIYRLYNKNMGVGLIVDLAHPLLESVPIRCEYQDEHRKVVMLECSMEDYMTLVNKQSNPGKSFPRLSQRLLIM